jgi:hypothetical protein
MDAGSNESNSKKSACHRGRKSIRNMIYHLLGKIDNQRCNNWLVQVLEIDQSISHPHKILGGVQARVFLRCLLSPAGGVLDVNLQRKQDD